MQSIQKILFPTDFSEMANNAFRYALWFSDHYQADIEVIHVLYPEVQAVDIPVAVEAPTQELVKVAHELMQTFVEVGLTQVGSTINNLPNIHPDVEVGAASMVIPYIAQRDKVDLIIMGTKGKHNRLEKIFGSVTTDVLRKAHCPVLVIPEHFTGLNIRNLVYATDLRTADPFHIWEISKLLHPFGLVMRVVHVSQEKEKNRPIDMANLEQFFQENAPDLDISFHELSNDNIVEELEDFIKLFNTDLLVLHKLQRSFFESLFHKSISRELALHAKTPLLVFK